jgi:hypothetical protein
MKKLFFIALAFIALSSCTVPDNNIPQSTTRLITISNDNKPFEYWLDNYHYCAETTVSILVEKNTQITITAVVEVQNNIPIIPNIKVYQNNVQVQTNQISTGWFIYVVN